MKTGRAGTMTAIAEWFDVNGYEPTRYKYNHDEDAVLVTIDFLAGVAAKAFATRFDGVDRSPHHQRLRPLSAEANRHR